MYKTPESDANRFTGGPAFIELDFQMAPEAPPARMGEPDGHNMASATDYTQFVRGGETEVPPLVGMPTRLGTTDRPYAAYQASAESTPNEPDVPPAESTTEAPAPTSGPQQPESMPLAPGMPDGIDAVWASASPEEREISRELEGLVGAITARAAQEVPEGGDDKPYDKTSTGVLADAPETSPSAKWVSPFTMARIRRESLEAIQRVADTDALDPEQREYLRRLAENNLHQQGHDIPDGQAPPSQPEQ